MITAQVNRTDLITKKMCGIELLGHDVHQVTEEDFGKPIQEILLAIVRNPRFWRDPQKIPADSKLLQLIDTFGNYVCGNLRFGHILYP